MVRTDDIGFDLHKKKTLSTFWKVSFFTFESAKESNFFVNKRSKGCNL